MYGHALTYSADFSSTALLRDLPRLVAPSVPQDRFTTSLRILDRQFASYLKLYPNGLWAPGLIVTDEMRKTTDLLLPLCEIAKHLRIFCSKALLFSAPYELPLLLSSSSWLDVVPRLPAELQIVNPANLLRLLLDDHRLRTLFLFAVHVPPRHGESFSRYPWQLGIIKEWLERNKPASVRCLDAACGTGEGTYDMARLILKGGVQSQECCIEGVSLDPLEIFSAAHAFFPHQPRRQDEFVATVSPIVEAAPSGILFSTGDMTSDDGAVPEPCDIIICNGVLGGPLLHERGKLEKAVSWLSRRLKPTGLLLADDRFHGGWKKKAPPTLLAELFRSYGVEPQESSEGFVGIRDGGQDCRRRR